MRVHHQPGRRSSFVVESGSEEDKDAAAAKSTVTSTAAVSVALKNSKSISSSATDSNLRSSSSSSLPQKVLSSPLRQAFAVAAAKSAAVKQKAAKLPALLMNGTTVVPLATTLKSAVVQDSVNMRR